ncbi:MAG: Maf family protein [Caldilineaceae bacterium]
MTEHQRPHLILASGSPRRREFLRLLELPHTIQAANIDETPLPEEPPLALAQRLAAQKAKAVASTVHNNSTLVIAADTVVAIDNESIGKPQDASEAYTMLDKLRNRTHQVITAVSVAQSGSLLQRTEVSITDVYMRNYSDAEIASYIATDDPFDKAGGYAIQHAEFAPVEQIQGCLSCVIGLPLGVLRGLLAEFDVSITRPLAPICEREMPYPCCQH